MGENLEIVSKGYLSPLYIVTKMRNVAGLSTSDAQKSSDLFLKCQYLDELTDSRGVVFATGTPVSNSMTELFTMMRYLQHDALMQRGYKHFDSWAADFGETTTAIELAPEGTGYRARTRFAKFYNLPELMSLFKEAADIKTADMLNLPTPEAVYHTELVQPSEYVLEMVEGLSERAAAIHSGGVDPSSDNMLKITSDGRKIGLDQRLMNDSLPDDPDGKVNTCVSNVFRIWDETMPKRSTQLVFCDMSTPKGDGQFNVYDDIKQKLMDRGVPDNEIAFIHDAKSEVQKKELFAKVRKGQVRVLLGSTSKMGSGTNVQDKLIALHDLDCPWRPSDLAQRAGRIVRQGNDNEQVHIFRYVTEKTFDAYLFQTLETKQRFISQIMTSKTPLRSCEDMDATALSFAEIKALCAGNPLIKEKTELDMQVRKLRLLKSNYQSQHFKLEDSLLKKYPAQIRGIENSNAVMAMDIELLKKHTTPNLKGFSPMTVGTTVYTEKEDAGKALLQACTDLKGSKYDLLTEPRTVGSYRGMEMGLSFNGVTSAYKLTLHGNKDYTVELGKDAFGNIARINNALDGLAQQIERNQAAMDDVRKQMDNARAELARPFEHEQELADKVQRLAEVDAALNLDEKDNEVLDYEVERPAVDAITEVSISVESDVENSIETKEIKDDGSYMHIKSEKEGINMMKVLLVKPGETPIETEIGSDLASMQQAVGGYIQAIYPFADEVAIVCNEEGKLNGLPLNRALYAETGEMHDILAGDFIVCGLGTENFSSLPPELMAKYGEMFKHPEQFVDIAGQIVAVKQPVEKQDKVEKSRDGDGDKGVEGKADKPKRYEPEL